MISVWLLSDGWGEPAFGPEGLVGNQDQPGADLSVRRVMADAHGNIRPESPDF